MTIELSIIGVVVGFISGFFGVGGGMLLVPILMYLGFNIKEAISISIMQMVFSSIYGSFLNFKKAIQFLKDGVIIGIGGFIGGLQNSFIIENLSHRTLQYMLIGILIFSIVRLFIPPSQNKKEKINKNIFTLFVLGFIIGLISMSVGIGGSLILVPILVAYFNYDLKQATSLGLFFVVFASVAGFASLSLNDKMLYEEGFIVAIASLIGVYFGIKAKDIIKVESYKKIILALNISILISLIVKLF